MSSAPNFVNPSKDGKPSKSKQTNAHRADNESSGAGFYKSNDAVSKMYRNPPWIGGSTFSEDLPMRLEAKKQKLIARQQKSLNKLAVRHMDEKVGLSNQQIIAAGNARKQLQKKIEKYTLRQSTKLDQKLDAQQDLEVARLAKQLEKETVKMANHQKKEIQRIDTQNSKDLLKWKSKMEQKFGANIFAGTNVAAVAGVQPNSVKNVGETLSGASSLISSAGVASSSNTAPLVASNLASSSLLKQLPKLPSQLPVASSSATASSFLSTSQQAIGSAPSLLVNAVASTATSLGTKMRDGFKAVIPGSSFLFS